MVIFCDSFKYYIVILYTMNSKIHRIMERVKKAGVILAIFAFVLVLFSPASYGATGTESENVWNHIQINEGNTSMLGGGSYIAVKTNSSFVGVIFGNGEQKNSVKIITSTTRYAGGIKIYDSSGHLKDSRVLKYRSFVGQSFGQILEFTGTGSRANASIIKGVNLTGAWNVTEVKITNISSNETLIEFTVYRDNLKYAGIRNSTSIGDGIVERVAFHFHIMVSLEHREIRGFPWYEYRPDTGVKLAERKNYSGDVVVFRVKYDKDIQGWDPVPGSKLAVRNSIFFGIAGNDRIIHMVEKRYGSGGARIGNNTYNNATLPHRRVFHRGGNIVFTGMGDWHRIGKFVWESNVTVDGKNRSAYYEINGGERIHRWFNHRAVDMVSIHGALIYPSGSSVFQDPMLEVNQLNIDFGSVVLPTGTIAMAGLVAAAVVMVGAVVYTRKHH